MRLWFPRPYEHTTHGGKTVDWLTKCALLDLELLLGYELTIEQGSYNHNAVAVSAGTHNGGGAVDLAPYQAARKVELARSIGFAAWHRPEIPGLWKEHVHMILASDARVSATARAQVAEYRAGRNGLASNLADDGPRQYVHRGYQWPGGRIALAKVRRNKAHFDPSRPTPANHAPVATFPPTRTGVLGAGDVYLLARHVGLSHNQAIVATAIAWAESGLHPNAVGDVGLEDSTWGPSVGLWQVRSLKSQTGTGGPRDLARLKDPVFNAHAMHKISNGGTFWMPWSTFINGAYRQYLPLVEHAVAEYAGVRSPILPTKAAGISKTAPHIEGKIMTEQNIETSAAPVVETPAPAPVQPAAPAAGGATSDGGAAQEPPTYIPPAEEPAAAPSTDLTAPVPAQPVAEGQTMVLGHAPDPTPAPAAADPAVVLPSDAAVTPPAVDGKVTFEQEIVDAIEKIVEEKIAELSTTLVQSVVEKVKASEIQKLETFLEALR